MSSSPPPPAKEDEEATAEMLDGEAPSHKEAADAATGVVDGGATANHTTLFGNEEVYYGRDHEEDMDSSQGDDSEEGDLDDVEFGSDEEGGNKFLPRAEFEATVEAMWLKVVGVVEEKPSAGHTCLVCMEPFTCEGHHRICCIPCGHMFGRSCLERWLHTAGKESAKCPQCQLQFEDKLIINLYTPANLGGGCGTIQEVKVYVTKAMDDVLEQCERRHEARLTEVLDELQNQLLDPLSTLKENLATASADLMSMKEGIKKMAEEEGVTPKDLVEFVEQNCPQLPSFTLTVRQPPTPAAS